MSVHLGHLKSAVDKWIVEIGPDKAISKDHRDYSLIADLIRSVDKQVAELGLRTGLLGVQRISEKLSKEAYKLRDLKSDLEITVQTIQDELASHLFLFVPFEDSQFYEDRPLLPGETLQPAFGELVAKRFSRLNYDIAEAGNCLALDRHTACVYHLSRVLEGVVDAVRSSLGLPAPNPSDPRTMGWGPQSTSIHNELRKREKAPPSPTWHSVEKPFYDEVDALLQAAKTAWRNPTAHLDKTYTAAQARRIFVTVKGLVEHIADHLDETGTLYL